MDQQGYNKLSQNVILENRKKLTISGVKDIVSFSDSVVLVITKLGNLTIKGAQLKINKFSTDTGDVFIEGSNISSFVYDNLKNGANKGFWSKIMR